MLRNLNDLTAWVLTDGKAGDEEQCLGLIEAMGGADAAIRRVKPRSAYSWLMPLGPIDPQERPQAKDSPIAPPFPDILVASGRRAVAYLRHVRQASGGKTFTVFLKDPRTGAKTADLIWVPEHDKLRGPNVVVTLTPPHRISQARLAAAREAPDPRLAGLKHPRVAVLAGGDSRHHHFTPEDADRFVRHLAQLAENGASLMITPSRRTPAAVRLTLRGLAARHDGFLWDGSGKNPYISLLALADGIVVTADSFNMIGEAAATGSPIMVFEPSGGHPKLSAFVAGLERYGAVHPFEGRLEARRYDPLDSTPVIARAVLDGLTRHRRVLGLPEPVPAPEIS